MAYDEQLGEAVRRHFAAIKVSTEEKKMMGGLCFMVDGKMCVGVIDEKLMLRLDPEVEASMLEKPGCIPMDFTGRRMRGFVYVEPDGLPTDEVLSWWLAQALEFNPRAKASKKRKRSDQEGKS